MERLFLQICVHSLFHVQNRFARRVTRLRKVNFLLWYKKPKSENYKLVSSFPFFNLTDRL